MTDTPDEYPEHTKYKASTIRLLEAKNLLEWLIEEQHGGSWPKTWGRDIDSGMPERVPKGIRELTDEEKTKLLLRYMRIDYEALMTEREAMVQELQKNAASRSTT